MLDTLSHVRVKIPGFHIPSQSLGTPIFLNPQDWLKVYLPMAMFIMIVYLDRYFFLGTTNRLSTVPNVFNC